MTLERMARIVKQNVGVKTEQTAIQSLVFVFAHPDGPVQFVPIVVFLEHLAKIAQNYVSALTMAVVIISRASVCVRQLILVTSVSIPALTICMDLIAQKHVGVRTVPHVIFLVDFVFVTRDGWALSAATECVLPIITEKIVQRPANAMTKIPKCMSCMTFFIFACLHFYFIFFILYYFFG